MADGGRIHHLLSYQRDATELAWPKYQASVVFRILCHYLVDAVPDNGVPEMLDSVVSLFEYYRVPSQTVVVGPERKQLPASLGKVYQSPTFHIPEE